MSQENVEIVRRIYVRWSEGDFSVGTDVFDPDIEYALYFGLDVAEGRGAEEMARAFGEYLGNWAEWRTGGIEEFVERGDTVVAFHSVRARGRQSQAEVEIRDAACGFKFRDGKIVKLVPGDSRRKVLEAVGLLE
jgi:ketosteroid isomerase-like protein